MGRKIASPCVGICKYKLDSACVGCGMTKSDKKKFKKLDGKKKKLKFVAALRGKQDSLGIAARWLKLYRRKCEKKDQLCALDELK